MYKRRRLIPYLPHKSQRIRTNKVLGDFPRFRRWSRRIRREQECLGENAGMAVGCFGVGAGRVSCWTPSVSDIARDYQEE